ncbi:MAG: glycoside hydrolase family 3 C-terminal domain-containing protein, partial [Bacilli bacterium]|nr:glycoside hydrolase family 3 C-terminal domain-containing protein [Bacilli bacterium]
MAKSRFFKGLAAAFACVLPITAYMSALAFDREGDVNLFLGITAGASANVGTYKSAYSSKEDLLKAEEEYEIETMAEGSVLLRNENNALPLTKTKITLFGNAAVYSNFHGGSGGPTNTGYSLYNSLKDEGFEINDTVYNKIKEVGYRAKNKDIAEVDPSIY